MIPSSPPKRIGPYRVLKVLGEGSLGQVYLAEQEEPVFRQVAVKVLKPGLDSEEVLTRFEAERKAMALMSHSGIVRVLDAGTTERGLSYLVMEYVDGLPIIEYCDTHKLSVNERLTLFCEICRAVHHAHQRGIIHRDLKPSNILVTEEDGQPLPKVIDFGIAKAIEQPLTDSAPMTIQGSFLGTPEYMSPEQAAGELDIDITTDVYALGVTLYELLTGVLPFGLRLAGLENLLRKLRIQEPPSLADRFDRQGAAREEIATERGTDTRSLRRRLKGELDWIVLKALRKERGHRYQSAS
ncbi:MAG: serine/threonine-protein kinase, partial [Acidobacteriota bacterium]